MNLNELKTKLNFIVDDGVQKNITVYVTSPAGLELFNMVETDLNDLMPVYVELLKSLVIENDDLSLGDYSTTCARENIIYLYDLSRNTRTREMHNMEIAGTNPNPPYFTVNSVSLEKIDGFYVVISNAEHRAVFYKQILPIDITYCRSSFFFGVVPDNSMFERKKENLLRVTPGIQMLYIDDEIILIEMSKLESRLGLDAILRKETEALYKRVEDRNIIVDIAKLREACEKPSNMKKLRHVLTQSKVRELTNDTIIQFAAGQDKLKFKFNDDKTMFNLDSKAAAVRFIKLMDDDYLYSKLTSTDYDSDQKEELQEAKE